MIHVSPQIQIPEQELTFQYARSSGKGGQNVNKTSTKALLKWNVVDTQALAPDVKERFLNTFRTRINAEGELWLQSERHRSQPMNAQDCIEKLVAMVLSVEKPPKPRKKTKPSKSQKKKRLESKRHQSDKKQSRRGKISW